MKPTITLLALTLIFNSCNGQDNAPAINNSSPYAIGDTVKQMDGAIWVMFQDRDNNYWFGSNEQGVYYQPADKNYFIHLTTQHGLSNNSILQIQQDAIGDMFFTTRSGISSFDGVRFATLPVVAGEWKLQPNDLWFKSGDGKKGPYRWDGQQLYALAFPKHYMEDDYKRRFANANYAYGPYDIYSIYKDRKGHIWLGTGSFGVCRYDGKTLSWLYEDHLTNTPSGGSFGIRSVFEDRQGKYWLCNTRYRYTIAAGDSTSNGYSYLKYTKENGIDGFKNSKGDDTLYYMNMVQDKAGDLWMLTYEQGVYRYDGKHTTRYTIRNGNRDIKLISMYMDKNGKLWVCTQKDGVYIFNGRDFDKYAL